MYKTSSFIILAFCISTVLAAQDFSSSDSFFLEPEEEKSPSSPSIFFADPFSEIETAEDDEYEESLERFYSYGRIMHLGAYMNFVNVMGNMSDIYTSGVLAGIRISYFIDWDLALTFHFGMGKLGVDILNTNAAIGNSPQFLTGGAIIGNLGLGLKYYINFHDISKVIAFLNPAVSLGAEMTVISDWLDDEILDELEMKNIYTDPGHRTVGPGMYFSFSIEFPIFRKSIYLGGEFTYHLSFFPSSNPEVLYTDPTFGNLLYNGHFMTYGFNLIWNL
jgi:hypothetical protein